MHCKSRNLFVTLLLVCAMSGGVFGQQGELAPRTGDSVLSGRVFGEDGKTPLTGASILAFHLSTEQTFRSAATGKGGEFRIDGLPYGYFDLAVEGSGGLFVGNQVINLPPGGKAAVLFSVSEFDTPPPPGDPRSRDFPGSEAGSSGLAVVSEKPRGRDFWRSPKGIAILGGAGAVVLLGLASSGGGSSDSVGSQSTP